MDRDSTSATGGITPLLWRRDGLQFGVTPGPVWLMQGEVADLRRAEAAARGQLPIDAADPALRPLAEAGLLPVPAADTRRSHVVEVRGAGRLGSLLAVLLATTRRTRVTVTAPQPVAVSDLIPGGFTAADVGTPAGPLLTRRLQRAGGWRPVGPETPRSLVVLADGSDLDPAVTDPLLRDGIAHLPLRSRGGVIQVGPLIDGGPGGCLRCLDHYRTAVDAEWPSLTLQLRATVTEESAPAQAMVAAGIAAGVIVRWLEGAGPPALTWVPPIGPPWQEPTRAHPACGCDWQAA